MRSPSGASRSFLLFDGCTRRFCRQIAGRFSVFLPRETRTKDQRLSEGNLVIRVPSCRSSACPFVRVL